MRVQMVGSDVMIMLTNNRGKPTMVRVHKDEAERLRRALNELLVDGANYVHSDVDRPNGEE